MAEGKEAGDLGASEGGWDRGDGALTENRFGLADNDSP